VISFMISVVPPKIGWTRLSRRDGEQRTGAPVGRGGLQLIRASRGVRVGRAGMPSRAWDRLAAPQPPEPGRGRDDHAEPAAADIPAVDADVDTGELIAAQLPQVLGDARSQPRQPGAAALPRAGARQSGPRPGLGRSPPQHEHARRPMAISMARPSSAGRGSPPIGSVCMSAARSSAGRPVKLLAVSPNARQHQGCRAGNVTYLAYGARHEQTAQPVRRHRPGRQGRWPPA